MYNWGAIFHDNGLIRCRGTRFVGLCSGVRGSDWLFDLGGDPGESRDLSFEQPAKVEALNALLSEPDGSDRSADSSAYPDDLPEAAREALRALGYLGDDEAVDGARRSSRSLRGDP